MPRLPRFTSDGLLPPGDYVLTLGEFERSMLVRGPGADHPWDRTWRGTLARNAGIVARHLAGVGIDEIYLDGSFVEAKPHPNDIDGYFVCDRMMLASGELERRLQKFDTVWTWKAESRRSATPGSKPQLPMWNKYRVELFPHVGQLCGIRDRHGHELMFPSAFRQTRDGREKGIIRIGGLT